MKTREVLRRALIEAAEQMVHDQGKNPVFAAPLAVRVLARLKAILTDEQWSELSRQNSSIAGKHLKLTGSFFGPILYPNYDSTRCSVMKFRDFLQAFPEVVKVHPGKSGDMVQILTVSAEDPTEMSNNYRSLLIRTLTEQIIKNAGGITGASITSSLIPINQLAIWMNRADTAFNVARLGYSSLLEWLQKVPEVKVVEENGLFRVGRTEEDDASSLSSSASTPLPAYLLVDSCDLISAMHEILGAKPIQSQLPDWGKVLQYCRDRWPKMDWKGRYFIAQTPDEHHSMEGFTHYLETVGFKVRSLNFEDGGATFEQSLQARNQLTLRGLGKGLEIIREGASPAITLVASHSPVLKIVLEGLLLKATPARQIGILGFPERMPREILSLKRKGLIVVDLERDCGAFKRPLKRAIGLNVEDLKAEDIL